MILFLFLGQKDKKYLEENIASLAVELTNDDIAKINKLFSLNTVAGMRYPEASMRFISQ